MYEKEGTFNWCFTEVTKVKTGDKKVDQMANRFFTATMEFCKEIRSSYKSIAKALSSILCTENMSFPVNDEQIDNFVKNNCFEEKGCKKLSFFLDFESASELFKSEFSIHKKNTDSDVNVSMVTPVTESMEQKFDEVKSHPFPEKIKNYLTKLGIYDICLEQQSDEEAMDIDFSNVIVEAYFVLEEKLRNAIIIKSLIMEDGYSGYIESDSAKKTPRLPEIETDFSVFSNEPDREWYVNMKCISINAITDYEGAGLTKKEYEDIAVEYLGEMGKCISERLDSEPIIFDAYFEANTQSYEEISEVVEGIGKMIRFNLEIAQRLNMDLEHFPDEYLPFCIINVKKEPINTIMFFSDNLKLVEIPLTPLGVKVPMTLTRYYGKNNEI